MRWARRHKVLAVACLGVVLAAWQGQGVVSWAAGKDSSVIEKLSVTFKTTYGEAGEIPDPEISISSGDCTLEEIHYRTDYENWKPGRKVRVELTVRAAEGKHFPVSLTKSQCKVSGANYVSAKSLDDDTIQVKADYKPVTVLEMPAKAGWSSSSATKAMWSPVDYAPGYSVVLYGDNKVVKRTTVETNSADFASEMDDMDKTYYYEVKAVPLTSDQKKYLKEGETIGSSSQEFDWEDFERLDEDTEKRLNRMGPGDGGSFKGDNYVMPDGSRAVNTWKKSAGKWYYFGADGNRTRGWMNQAGRWYYMDQNGEMCTGWVNPGGDSWFYLNPDGDMQTGWIQPLPGEWYHTDQSGCMQRGWVLVDGKWYYFAQSGRMQTGWIEDNGRQYYLYGDGAMAVNTTIAGRTLGPDGAAVDGQ